MADIPLHFPSMSKDEVKVEIREPLKTTKRKIFSKGSKLRNLLPKRSRSPILPDDSTYVSEDLSSTCTLDSVPTTLAAQRKHRKEKMKVRFNTSRHQTKIHKIDPLFAYTDDLWWSPRDLQHLRSQQADFSKVSDEVKNEVKVYLNAYILAHQESRKFDRNGQDEQSGPRIAARTYMELASGRGQGFAGLEMFAGKFTMERRKRAKKIVALILSAHNECALNRYSNPEKIVRAYARSLTAADRFWSVAIVSADCIAESGINA